MGVMNHTIGIKKDGTCVAVGDNSYRQCNVSSWKDIKQIAAGSNHTIGLKKDNTCVVIGDNSNGQCNVQNWKDVVLLMDNLNHAIIKYILNNRNKYFSINDKYYNSETRKYESIGNKLDILSIKEEGFKIKELLQDRTIGEETFKPISKFNRFKLDKYEYEE